MMSERDGKMYCDRCNDIADMEAYRVHIGNIMSFDLCGERERVLESIVLNYLHEVKE